jgi:hypothetical protein
VTAAPDLIEPVVGFRKWRVVRGHITSPYVPLRWSEREVHARCYPANRSLLFGAGWLDEPHDAPHPDCKCGVYAWHDPPQRGPIPDLRQAFGIVSLWGRIEVHADGMRAEHARIEALAHQRELGSAHLRAVGRVARALGVALIEYGELPAAARAVGSGVPVALRPG